MAQPNATKWFGRRIDRSVDTQARDVGSNDLHHACSFGSDRVRAPAQVKVERGLIEGIGLTDSREVEEGIIAAETSSLPEISTQVKPEIVGRGNVKRRRQGPLHAGNRLELEMYRGLAKQSKEDRKFLSEYGAILDRVSGLNDRRSVEAEPMPGRMVRPEPQDPPSQSDPYASRAAAVQVEVLDLSTYDERWKTPAKTLTRAQTPAATPVRATGKVSTKMLARSPSPSLPPRITRKRAVRPPTSSPKFKHPSSLHIGHCEKRAVRPVIPPPSFKYPGASGIGHSRVPESDDRGTINKRKRSGDIEEEMPARKNKRWLSSHRYSE